MKDVSDNVTRELDIGAPGAPYIVHSAHWVNKVFVADTSTQGKGFASIALDGQNAWLTQTEAAELGLVLLKIAGHMRARVPL
jgi:hypothetical protein